MPFLAPLALAGLVFVPLVIAMYLLKLRRDEAVVPSTLLWQRLVADVEANAPWQRLRRSLLLLLQLLLVLILVFLAARPFVERPAGLAGDLVLVLDTSASMQATDVTPNRLEAAKAAAVDALKDLPAGGKVSVIAAGRTARVVANGTSDIGRVRQAIASVQPTSDIGNLADALRLASALAARSGDAEILVATDAALATPPSGAVQAPIRVLRVGRDANNQAIVALAVKTAASGLSHSAFVSVANLGLELVERQVQVFADGQLRDSRTLRLDPQRRTDVSIDDIDDPDHPASVVEVRLLGPDGATTPADALGVDDRAWAVVPPNEKRQVLLAGEPDPYLETALSFLPDTELYFRDGDEWSTLTGLDEYELVIFNRFLPPTLPAIADARDRAAANDRPGDADRHAHQPGHRRRSTRRTRSCATSTSRRSTSPRPRSWSCPPGRDPSSRDPRARRCCTPAPWTAGPPRSWRSSRGARTCRCRWRSPCCWRTSRASSWAARRRRSTPSSPARRSPSPVPEGAGGVRVERPDGSVDELVAPTAGAASVTFARTDLLGVYTVTRARRLGRLAGRVGRRPRRAAAPSPAASADGEAASPTFRPAEAGAPSPVRRRPARRGRVRDRARATRPS